MERSEAEFLAGIVVEQFKVIPLAIKRMNLDKEKLTSILANSPSLDHPKRMQYRINASKKEGLTEYMEDPSIPGNDKETGIHEIGRSQLIVNSFQPTRVITTYDTDFQPDVFEIIYRSVEERLSNKGKFIDEVVCRALRTEPDVNAIRRRAKDAKYFFGVMARFTVHLDIKKGPPHYGGEQEVIVPLIFIPGTIKEDLDTLARFSIKMQRPSHDSIKDYTTERVFEDRLYEENK